MKLYRESALQNLLVIYQQEKDWEKSLEVADRLEQLTGQSLSLERAHFYCELAEEASSCQDVAVAQEALKKALHCDPRCVRATLLQARMAISRGEFPDAVVTLKRVEHQDLAYLSETLPMLRACYQQLGDGSALTRCSDTIKG